MCLGYFFTGLICIGVAYSIVYWLYKLIIILANNLKTYSTKIERDGYIYVIAYKYVEYDCFLFTAFKDWFFVIKRYPKYPLKFRFNKKYIEFLSKEDKFVIYSKGYRLCKFKSLDEAKSKLNEYLEKINEFKN